MGSRCVKFGVIALTLSYWSLEVQHGTSWQRTLWGSEKRIVALHKDGVGYKKIAKTLELSCSTVAKTIQRFNRTGSTQNRPCHGRPKKLSARAQRHIQRLCLGNRCMSAASIAAEVEGVGGQPVSTQTIRRTLHQIGLHGCRPRRKPLKMMHKKAHKQFAEDKQTKDMQGSQNFKIPGSPSGRYSSDFGSPKIYLTSPNKKKKTFIIFLFYFIYIYIYIKSDRSLKQSKIFSIHKYQQIWRKEFFHYLQGICRIFKNKLRQLWPILRVHK